jgi:TctA family transporter
MLTLGIPAHPVMALMIGAFIIQGITPGPNVITDEPALFWGIIVSMWVGNLMLVLLNLPLIGLWVKLLTVPYRVLFPAIIVFASLGCYAIAGNHFDVYAIAVFGAIGYVLVKLGCEPAPLLLGFVLGPLLEEHLRRAMILSRGDPMIFLERPISATLLAFAALAIVVSVLPAVRKKRDEVFVEED